MAPSSSLSSSKGSKSRITENIQVTVHSDNEVKKITATPPKGDESSNEKQTKSKLIRRKVYLNKQQKTVQEPQVEIKNSNNNNNKESVPISNKTKLKISNEDESSFEPNYLDEEFDCVKTTTKPAKIAC